MEELKKENGLDLKKVLWLMYLVFALFVAFQFPEYVEWVNSWSNKSIINQD